MKDPSRSSTSPSIINEDVIINGHSHEDDNPFAEYMWMENEEEFNRQVSFVYKHSFYYSPWQPSNNIIVLVPEVCFSPGALYMKYMDFCATTAVLFGCWLLPGLTAQLK